MKYLSLFSGIGGFEVAIHQVYSNAQCIGFSEIKPNAIKIYKRHFPDHENLGDISAITTDKILSVIKNGCDLVVAGFPCTNLSSMAGIRGTISGLDGEKSGLFYELTRILKVITSKIPNVKFIIENNASMSKQNKALITAELEKIYKNQVFSTIINNADISVQVRRRIFWTTFPVEQPKLCKHTWDDILEPLTDIPSKYFVSEKFINGMNTNIPSKGIPKNLVYMLSDNKYQEFNIEKNDNGLGRTRYQLSMHSDTGTVSNIPYAYPYGKARPICAGGGGGFSRGMLVDRRCKNGKFKFRYFTMREKERLFGFPDYYTDQLSDTTASDLLGNAVSVLVIEHILENILVFFQIK